MILIVNKSNDNTKTNNVNNLLTLYNLSTICVALNQSLWFLLNMGKYYTVSVFKNYNFLKQLETVVFSKLTGINTAFVGEYIFRNGFIHI